MRKRSLHDLAILSLLLSAGIILQAVETIYLPPLIIPGAKLGIANSITLIMIALFNWREVLAHVLLRVTAVALVSGTFLSTTYIYSVSGGLLSALIMLLLSAYLYGPLSFVGISLVGALTHNLAQLTLAVIILGHIGIITLMPWLISLAIIAGLANGVMVNSLYPRLYAVIDQLGARHPV